ncbi:glycosyltransferase family 2 protein [Pseudomonas qingdaonensis]|nr:glycosyltransferase family 2 protein [Pseudomonas qingdaonensis]
MRGRRQPADAPVALDALRAAAHQHVLDGPVAPGADLTGRLSFFRASVMTDPEFIRDVEADFLEHWRLGRFQFLTGDDKSSWLSLMRAGWDTFYVPDSNTLTVEHPPDNSFWRATRQLMFRWYGNSLRQNFRATHLLGRARLGLFTLYVLLDQRVSMWTCLMGLTASVVAGVVFGIEYLLVYLFWVLLSRSLVTVLFCSPVTRSARCTRSFSITTRSWAR